MAKKGDQVILPEGTGNPRIDPDRREASSEQSWVAEDDCCSPGEETGNGRDDCEVIVLRAVEGMKRPRTGVLQKFSDWVRAQASSSSSDRCSKFRGRSQNNPRVSSKRNVDITKLSTLSR
ncbi:hypothetical protein AVEN_40131-1 [Araneus ventricosus]|uniref:Uncharacterized protein n=1 Tax=Araneus ventricosus TaxID=182803 RepID=A0A4Y2EJU7_ARAVE|nr:hypothetical protein AVEN_40131-1 [Araneus ventricosus]